jgi:hypothetical protein
MRSRIHKPNDWEPLQKSTPVAHRSNQTLLTSLVLPFSLQHHLRDSSSSYNNAANLIHLPARPSHISNYNPSFIFSVDICFHFFLHQLFFLRFPPATRSTYSHNDHLSQTLSSLAFKQDKHRQAGSYSSSTRPGLGTLGGST